MASEGLLALRELHQEGEVTLFAAAVVARDSSGGARVTQAAVEGPLGTAVTMMTASLVGLLARPIPGPISGSVPSLTGFVFDPERPGTDFGFLNDVVSALAPGRTAVIAELQETWVTPVDTRLAPLGGVVFRRIRSSFLEDQLVWESAVFATELRQVEEELLQASPATEPAARAEIEAVRKKLEATRGRADARAKRLRSEVDAKVDALHEQMRHASQRAKANIQKRIAEVKTQYGVFSSKLEQAEAFVEEAVPA